MTNKFSLPKDNVSAYSNMLMKLHELIQFELSIRVCCRSKATYSMRFKCNHLS